MWLRVNTTEAFPSMICTKIPSRCFGSPDHLIKFESVILWSTSIVSWILTCKLIWFSPVETIPDTNCNCLQKPSSYTTGTFSTHSYSEDLLFNVWYKHILNNYFSSMLTMRPLQHCSEIPEVPSHSLRNMENYLQYTFRSKVYFTLELIIWKLVTARW